MEFRLKYIILFSILFSTLFLMSGCGVSDEEAVRYVSKKYDIDSVVTFRGEIDEGNMGSTSIIMEDENGVEFNLKLKGFFFSRIVEDDYKIVKKENETKLALENGSIDYNLFKSNIKKLGYSDVLYKIEREGNDKDLYLEILLQGNYDIKINEKENFYELIKLAKNSKIEDLPIKNIIYNKKNDDLDTNNKLVKEFLSYGYYSIYKDSLRLNAFNSMFFNDIQKINKLTDLENSMLEYTYNGKENGSQVLVSNFLSESDKYSNIFNEIDTKIFSKSKIMCDSLYSIKDLIEKVECSKNVLLLYTDSSSSGELTDLIKNLTSLITLNGISDGLLYSIEIVHSDEYNYKYIRLDKATFSDFTTIEEFLYHKYNLVYNK